MTHFLQILPTLEQKCIELRKTYEQMKSVKRGKEKIQKLQHELAWSLVHMSKKVKLNLIDLYE